MKLKSILATTLALGIVCAGSLTTFASAVPSEIDEESVAITSIETSENTTITQRKNNAKRFETLLTEGIISESTYNAMTAYMAANMPEKPERSERTGMIDSLLEANIITQAEYDAMKEIAASGENSREIPADGSRENRFKLFESVLSEETIDAIKTYLETNQVERTNNQDRPDFMAEMVEANILTQSESDAIKAAMPKRTEKNSTNATESANQA